MMNKIMPYQPSNIKLNSDFFVSADGVYSSYWIGKIISSLIQKGKKKTAATAVYKSLNTIKYATQKNPVVVVLELLDKIKPNFRLRNYIVRRVVIKEYPVVASRTRQLMLGIHWLKSEIKTGSGQFGSSLSEEVASKILEFRGNPKKHSLIKKRNEYTKRTITAQFNIRYSWK